MRLRRRQPYSHHHIQRTPLHLPRLRRLPHLRLLRSLERLVDPRDMLLCQALRVLFHGLHDLCSLFATLGYVLHLLFSTITQEKEDHYDDEDDNSMKYKIGDPGGIICDKMDSGLLEKSSKP
ncbi:hypothetical protein LOK49_LG06G01047 [Camellia lanceoleosa]|uniref:Uncharacterized protein n=1 Tax=Camellia lanceoleosa TaxID=1840588 RepID=A0ACC0HAR7_9ERIC|nr:hypothetical protein LOK49_LG06G01047 [Camellia lanceoleosa]